LIEKNLYRESHLKGWIEKQIKVLSVNGSAPDVNEFLNGLGTNNFDDAVKFGALDAPLNLYDEFIDYCSGFSTKESAEEYSEKAWMKIVKYLMERRRVKRLIEDIRLGICDDCYVVSKEDFYNIYCNGECDVLTEAEEATLTKHQLKLLDLLRMDAAMTYGDMARHVGRSRAAVSKDIARLKELGLLKRVGSDKTGHWVASLPSSKS
jgi:biotin operon repressor